VSRGRPVTHDDCPGEAESGNGLKPPENVTGPLAAEKHIRTVQYMSHTTDSLPGFLKDQLSLPTELFTPAPELGVVTGTVVRPDTSWRIRDSEVFTALGWTSGATVAFKHCANGYRLRLAPPSHSGLSARVDTRSRFVLPRTARDFLHAAPCEPLLLVADTTTGEATITTLSTIYLTLKDAS
jgi:hypothetical protein